MTLEFNKTSYERHKKHYEECFDAEKLDSWKNKNTVDYWRHRRMYSNLDPIINSFPTASWLTIGDGRYGTDANYLISNGVSDVLATDISDTHLKVALAEGFISKYKVENAESLTFGNNSFDFILCKESYHHFPRPMVALYEMIRVARRAVILIEPQDSNILIPSRFKLTTLLKWTAQVVKNYIKGKIGKEPYYHYGNYEEVGNYVYTISEREIEKAALGLNLPMVSFKQMNDYYVNGAEFEVAKEESELFKEVQGKITKKDKLSNLGYEMAGLLIAVVHKSTPDQSMIEGIKKAGFSHKRLPVNPYSKL